MGSKVSKSHMMKKLYKRLRSRLHRARLCRVETAYVGHFVLIKSEFSEELVTAEFFTTEVYF